MAGPPGVMSNSFAAKSVTSLPAFLDMRPWVHEFEPTRKIVATFLALPGATFTVDSPRASRGSSRVEPRVSRVANLVGEFSDASSTCGGTSEVKVTWSRVAGAKRQTCSRHVHAAQDKPRSPCPTDKRLAILRRRAGVVQW